MYVACSDISLSSDEKGAIALFSRRDGFLYADEKRVTTRFSPRLCGVSAAKSRF
jgi:hypothetical protein